jgi:hypothetical protein
MDQVGIALPVGNAAKLSAVIPAQAGIHGELAFTRPMDGTLICELTFSLLELTPPFNQRINMMDEKKPRHYRGFQGRGALAPTIL